MNWRYFIVVTSSSLIFPIIATLVDKEFTIEIFSKWFIFFAVGTRLFVAGIKQVFDPKFTAREIFEIKTDEVFPIVRELGFANICFGLVGILSIMYPTWQMVSAFASGLYYGFAGLMHIIKKPKTYNEKIALFSDLYIFIVLITIFLYKTSH